MAESNRKGFGLGKGKGIRYFLNDAAVNQVQPDYTHFNSAGHKRFKEKMAMWFEEDFQKSDIFERMSLDLYGFTAFVINSTENRVLSPAEKVVHQIPSQSSQPAAVQQYGSDVFGGKVYVVQHSPVSSASSDGESEPAVEALRVKFVQKTSTVTSKGGKHQTLWSVEAPIAPQAKKRQPLQELNAASLSGVCPTTPSPQQGTPQNCESPCRKRPTPRPFPETVSRELFPNSRDALISGGLEAFMPTKHLPSFSIPLAKEEQRPEKVYGINDSEYWDFLL